MSKSKRVVESIEGLFGQNINPGDEVVFVTEGYQHSVYVRRGIYIGHINGNAQVRYKTNRWNWIIRKHEDVEAISTLQLNRLTKFVSHNES